MRVNELRIAGDFEIPDATVDEEIEVTLRVKVVGIERDTIDVSGYGTGPEVVEGGLRVEAVALAWIGWPVPAEPPPAIPPDYAESAE